MNETPLEQDPAIYLRQQPSPSSPCHVLVELVGSHDGAPVPMHMLAKVAVRLHRAVDWMARWDGREKLARRLGMLVVSAALANVAAIAYHWLAAHDARIVAEADARAARERLEQLEQSVRLIQQTLMRMSGGDHPPTSEDLRIPDSYSFDGDGGGDVEGGSSPQRPKLHLPQPLCGLIWHSTLLEQMSPHTLGVMMGLGDGAGAGAGPHPNAIATRNTMTLDMPMLYPLLHVNLKEIAP